MINWIKKNAYSILFLIISLIFFAIPVSKVRNINYLFANDPRYHMYMAQHGEPQKYYNDQLYIKDDIVQIHYPSLMRSGIYLLHRLTDIDYFVVFKYSGFILRFFTIVIVLGIIKNLTGHTNKKYLILIALVLYGHYYFRNRSRLTFTENYILFFQSIILLFGVLHLKSNKFSLNTYLISSFFVVASLRYHKPSFIAPFFYITMISILSIIKFRNIKILRGVFMSISISAPVIQGMVSEYTYQLTHNVGNTSGYGDLRRFVAPGIKDYINFSSAAIFSMGRIGLARILRNKLLSQNDVSKRNIKTFLSNSAFILIIGAFLFTFFLSNTVRVGLNLPIDRMQGFFMINLLVIAGLGYRKILQHGSKFLLLILFAGTLTNSLTIVNNNRSRYKTRKGELEIGSYLTKHYSINKNYYFSGVSFMDSQFPYYKQIINNFSNLRQGDIVISDFNTIKQIDKKAKMLFKTSRYGIYEKQ